MSRREKREEGMLQNRIMIYLAVAVILVIAIAGIIIAVKNKNSNVSDITEEIQVGENSQEEIENTESASTTIGSKLEESIENTQEISNQNDSITEETAKKEDSTTTSEDTTSEKTTKEETAKEKSSSSTKEEKTETKEESNVQETEPTFIKPVEGEVIKGFSKDNLVFSNTLQEWVTHLAVDIKASTRDVVKCAADGTVTAIKNDPRYGLTVIVEHSAGFKTVYSNLLTAEFVVEGETVKQGQTLGTIGTSATFEIADEAHLHFEMLKNSEYVDPSLYINF